MYFFIILHFLMQAQMRWHLTLENHDMDYFIIT